MARVLIVDDSATERAVLVNWLHKAGHVALEAQDAESGVALARQQKPDVVLMDVIMPGRNGFEATRSLRRDPATSHIPVIIISTKDQPTDQAWGMRQGASAYLPKPFSRATLIEAIAVLLPGNRDA